VLNLRPDRLTDLTLPILGQQEQLSGCYVCPGSNAPISRSLHLARLYSAWSGCDACEWNSDTEGLAERGIRSTQTIRSQRADGIRRTEFGIRGQYINALDRRTAGRLMRAFCHFFTSMESRTATECKHPGSPTLCGLSGDPAGEPIRNTEPLLIAGYDGRSFSPDLFVGITSAVCQYGCSLIDIGQATACSLLEAIRRFPGASGGVLVTGAGMPPSYTGFDVFDSYGAPVPVVWKDHGITLQPFWIDQHECPSDSDRIEMSARSSGSRDGLTAAESHDENKSAAPGLLLSLPDMGSRYDAVERIGRRSGTRQIVAFEEQYREWLLRWYPDHCQIRLVVLTDSGQLAERVQWLARRSDIDVICRGSSDIQAAAAGVMTVRLHEDDRRFDVFDRSLNRVPPAQLAARINRSPLAGSLHITAHSDNQSYQCWLTDTGRPHSMHSTESIHDALAILGMLLRTY
jgi:hypothetical protein